MKLVSYDVIFVVLLFMKCKLNRNPFKKSHMPLHTCTTCSFTQPCVSGTDTPVYYKQLKSCLFTGPLSHVPCLMSCAVIPAVPASSVHIHNVLFIRSSTWTLIFVDKIEAGVLNICVKVSYRFSSDISASILPVLSPLLL